MIEQNKCPKCHRVYEVLWDDSRDEYYIHLEDEDETDDFDLELYPEYCPFCGVHREYGGEEDSSDDLLDK